MTDGPERARAYATMAEDELVRRYLPLARRIVRRHFRQAGALVGYDDLDQEAALALIAAARDYDPAVVRSFPAYAATRIRWRVRDYLRRVRAQAPTVPLSSVAQPASLDPDDAPEVEAVPLDDFARAVLGPGAGGTVEDQVLDALAVERLRAAIAELPPGDQVVLALYWQEQLSYEEIARVLGSTGSTVWRRHQRILRALWEKLRGTEASGEKGEGCDERSP